MGTQPKPSKSSSTKGKKTKTASRTFDLSSGSAKGLKPPNMADREAMWRRADFNGNGMCSLAELDKLVVELWPQFDNKPALMRAYKAADKNNTGFVSKKEFNFFLDFLVHFTNLWHAFDRIDRDDDRRVTIDEFVRGAEALRIKRSRQELEELFRSIDTNGGGYVLFDEFCSSL